MFPHTWIEHDDPEGMDRCPHGFYFADDLDCPRCLAEWNACAERERAERRAREARDLLHAVKR